MKRLVNLPISIRNNFPISMKINVNLSDDSLFSSGGNESFRASGDRLRCSNKTVYRLCGKEVLSFGSLHDKRNKKAFQRGLDK